MALKALVHIFASFLMAALTLVAFPSLACSSFALENSTQRVVAKSFDFPRGHGMLVINRRGLSKKALVLNTGEAAEWVSKYGSLTFNQVGLEFPYGGINERGLTVEILWYSDTDLPETAGPQVNESQWIQYILDTSATLDEAITNASKVSIRRVWARVHYFVCDRSKNCAAFEYLNKKLNILRAKSIQDSAIENQSYTSISEPKPMGRLATLKETLKKSFAGKDLVSQAFDLLAKVKQSSSKWQIVYDIFNQKVHIKTEKSPLEKTFDLAEMDFSCHAGTLSFDVNSTQSGIIKPCQFASLGVVENIELAKQFGEIPTPVALLAGVYPSLYTQCVAAK